MPIGNNRPAARDDVPPPADFAARWAGDLGHLEATATFAVVHDEPFLTIVYDEGEFKGRLEEGTLDGLDRARDIATAYNLEIYQVRMDCHSGFMLYLKDKGGTCT
jgi:hypothetical protein